MQTKTHRLSIRASDEEMAAIAELARMTRHTISQAVIDAVYAERDRARQQAALNAAWERAQEAGRKEAAEVEK